MVPAVVEAPLLPVIDVVHAIFPELFQRVELLEGESGEIVEFIQIDVGLFEVGPESNIVFDNEFDAGLDRGDLFFDGEDGFDFEFIPVIFIAEIYSVRGMIALPIEFYYRLF